MNAKNELVLLLKRFESVTNVICADIHARDHRENSITLKMDYTPEEYNKFLDELDFEYDAGFGSQELMGTAWMTNDYWLERGEYDGSEWWKIKNYPTIPDYLY